MKNKKQKNKNLFASKRNTHKRKNRERARAELLRAVRECGVGTDALHVRDIERRELRERGSKKREEKLTRGIFSSSKSGFGFVTGEDGYGRDIFIPEGSTLGAIDGDVVEISYHIYYDREGSERTEGRVRRIVEYGRRTLIGTLEYKREKHRGVISYLAYLIPDDPKVSITPIVTDTQGAREGEKVMLLLNRKSSLYGPSGEVIEIFGETMSREANYKAILAECEIPTDFSREELAEADFFAGMPLSDTDRVRRDNEIIFTIDSESAKDLDDAISVRRIAGGGWQLGVHIADVSSYVKERTHLDRAVMARGTSVYFTDKVVPMLPPALSNGACSLNPGEEKYALSAIIRLDKDGEILGTRLEKSIIKSRIKGIYSEINSIFENRATPDTVSKYKPLLPTLMRMRELYLLLKEKSEARGSLELEGAECEIVLDEGGTPIDIVKRERGDAEKMIEQFMLTANEAVARLLSEKGIPCVYRIHENPPPEKLTDFATYAQNLGLRVTDIMREGADSRDFAALLSAAREKEISLPVSYTLLRSMAKAKYSDKRERHFGLSLEYYCHFTSPIRRLSDLATHRIIHKVLFDGKRAEAYASYAKRAAAAATDAELRALTAERKIENLYKVIYMSGRLGEEFDAIITSVTSFGFFAELDNTCEGLVPISTLPGVFTFEERALALRSSLITYRLGQRVRVRLEEADMIRGKLRFSVV